MKKFLTRLGLLLAAAGLGAIGYRRLTGKGDLEARSPTGRAEWSPLQPATPVADKLSAPAWVEPRDGTCPDSHPIKANADSGIYHVPGGRSYRSTKAERCYCETAGAEADGFRAAKR